MKIRSSWRVKFLALIFAFITVPFQSLLGCSADSLPAKHIRYQDEQQWLVDSIGTDISEILLFAAKKNGQSAIDLASVENQTTEFPNLTYQYELKWNKSGKPESKKFTLAEYVWSPNNYAPWTAQLMERLNLAKSPSAKSASASEILRSLGNYESSAIARENKSNSQCLSDSPLDPQAHENAALLCGVMALRDCAASFENFQPALNRICAHLAIARALRGKDEFSDSGKFAEIILLTLCGREGEAITRIDKWETKLLASDKRDATVKSWLNAIKIRCTHNYRLADLDNALVIEKIAYMRALSNARTVDAVNDYLDKTNGAKKNALSGIDWLRIAPHGHNSVTTGHQYAETGVESEIEDYKADYSLFKSANQAPFFTSDLNLEPTRCLVKEGEWKLEAISWADVAAFHARQLMQSIFQRHHFEIHMWGVPDTAKDTIAFAERDFGQVRLFPLCKLSMIIDASSKKHPEDLDNPQLTQAVADLITSEPQFISVVAWKKAFEKAKPPNVIPDPWKWLSPVLPFGTAFEIVQRYYHLKDYSLAHAEELKKLSPYSRTILGWLIQQKYGKNPTGDQLSAELGSLPEFDTSYLSAVATAYKADPVKYCQMLEKLAGQNPKYYFALGEQYVSRSEPGKAVIAYENGVRLSPDRVSVSNSCEWLVFYYYDHGEKDKALALASECARVYSARGLLTMAKLQEQMGHLQEAEEYFSKTAERYNEQEPLNQFYKRHQKDNIAYKNKANLLPRNPPPTGLRKAVETDYQKPPINGVVLAGVGQAAQKYGLKLGDVLVGLDGYFITSLQQYLYVWNMPEDSPTTNPPGDSINLVVWDGQAYRKLTAVLPNRRLGCRLEDYKP